VTAMSTTASTTPRPVALRTTPPGQLGTILSIWAHPDDETYLAAGIMAAARDHGQRVVCVSATAGEHGTDDTGTWPPARLGTVRRWEAAAAMAVLGVTEHHVLGFADGELVEDDEWGVAQIAALIDDVDPDTILTFGADGMTYHPDHIAVHHWVTTAWRQRGGRARLLYATTTVDHVEQFRRSYEDWNMYMTDERPTGVPPDQLGVHVELDGPDLDRKLTALRALATQTGGLMARLDPATYAAQVAEESFIDASPARRARPRRPAVAAPDIRPSDASDTDAIVELALRAWAPVFASFEAVLGPDIYQRVYPDWRWYQAGSVREALERNQTWVAVTDGAITGFVNVSFDTSERSGEIYMIAVDPRAQRQGIASRLTELALGEMRARGLDLATVATGGDPAHAPARATYEKAGFTAFPQVWYAKLLDR
jgi:LmbE family N-acetylglucosaminyl deacetylase/GNAT superfamily N-acetyltransferase